ncbi:MAG: STAS domain-containing protein [Caldilineaceae bacterium]|nr:STAS domain-containing protein [Caldilineaceae bacterium]
MTETTMLEGAITFENFAVMRGLGERQVDGAQGEVEIDLGRLEHANSLTVSAMVAWFRHAQKQGKAVRFRNVSGALRKIIGVSGLQGVLLGEK